MCWLELELACGAVAQCCVCGASFVFFSSQCRQKRRQAGAKGSHERGEREGTKGDKRTRETARQSQVKTSARSRGESERERGREEEKKG